MPAATRLRLTGVALHRAGTPSIDVCNTTRSVVTPRGRPGPRARGRPVKGDRARFGAPLPTLRSGGELARARALGAVKPRENVPAEADDPESRSRVVAEATDAIEPQLGASSDTLCHRCARAGAWIGPVDAHRPRPVFERAPREESAPSYRPGCLPSSGGARTRGSLHAFAHARPPEHREPFGIATTPERQRLFHLTHNRP